MYKMDFIIGLLLSVISAMYFMTIGLSLMGAHVLFAIVATGAAGICAAFIMLMMYVDKKYA